MIHAIPLDENYSTTRLLTQEKPIVKNNPEDSFETVLFLPQNDTRKGEGGLRAKGYFKNSYEDKPLISIITVVYNGEKYLEETILSVINQTYDNVEYVIIDGGSTDGTLDIIKKYEEKIDYWVSEKDCGIYDAMNKGIALCNGEIIGIVNADDFIYKETLEKVANEFLDLSIMFVYGNLDLISDDGEIFNSIESVGINTIRYKMFRQMPFLHPTMFVRTTVYKLIGLFDTAYKLSSDYDFSLRLIENNLMSKNIGCVTGVFRLGGQSGGIKTYRENHKISLIHRTNPFFVYLNTAILILKMLGRNMFSKGN